MYFFHPWNGCSIPPNGYADNSLRKQYGSYPHEMDQELSKVICAYRLNASATNCGIDNSYIPTTDKCANAIATFPIECDDGPANGDSKVYSFSENVPTISFPHVKVEYFFDSQCSVESISKIAYFELNKCLKVGSHISGASYAYAMIGNSGDWKFFSDKNCVNTAVNVKTPETPVFPDVSEYDKCELSTDVLSRETVGDPSQLKQYYIVASVQGDGGGGATKDNDLTIDQEISLSGLVVGLFLGAVVVAFYGFSVFGKATPGYTQGKDVEVTVA